MNDIDVDTPLLSFIARVNPFEMEFVYCCGRLPESARRHQYHQLGYTIRKGLRNGKNIETFETTQNNWPP